MTNGGETGSETHEDRIWTAGNSPNPPMCKILSEGTNIYQWLLKMEIHPIIKTLDNSTYIITNTVSDFFLLR